MLSACVSTGQPAPPVAQTGQGAAAQPAGPAQQKPAAGLDPYKESIPGTQETLEMIPVPAGSVTLQTPEGPKTVEVGPFWISKTEVSWDLYDVFVYGLDAKAEGAAGADAISRPSKPYVLPGESFGHQGNPALGMTLKAAQAFTDWLTKRTGHTYRLATEAEWEYACRAGQTGAPSAEQVKEQAWFWDNANNQTHKIGALKPNAWGLHDLLGNAAEWVTTADGTPVIKGGSYKSELAEIQCGTRQAQTPAWNMTDPQIPKSTWWLSDAPFLGLRVVREP